MPCLEIYYQRDQRDPADDGWCARIDGSTYDGGGHISGTEDLGPDDIDGAVAAWLRSRDLTPLQQQIAGLLAEEPPPPRQAIADALGCSLSAVDQIARRLQGAGRRGRPRRASHGLPTSSRDGEG